MPHDRLWEWLRPALVIVWLILLVVWPRLTTALTLLGIGGAFIAYNAFIFWSRVVHKAPAPSVAPIVGGIMAAAGVATLPLDGAWHWAWIPLLLDWGGLPMFMGAWFMRERG